MVRYISFGLLFFGLLGCRSVRPTDLPGTWVITDTSRRVLPIELQTAWAKIVLDKNGTFIASNMPGFFYFPKRDDSHLDSGSGVWKLVSIEGEQQLQLEFQTIAVWNGALPYDSQIHASRGVCMANS